MAPQRKPSSGGSRGNNRNRRMGRGGSFRRGPLEKIKRNKPRARIFKRSDSEDSDRRESFDRSSKGKSDNYGGHDFYKKRPRPGPKPKEGAWGGQSRKSYKEHEKKFWREPPKAKKNMRPSRDNVVDSGSDSEGEFGERDGRNFDHNKISRRKNKKRLGGGKKKKGRTDNDGYTSPDPTQSELEKAYASFEENEELIYERAKIGMSKRLTDKEMMLEIRKRDKEQYIADRNRGKKGVTVVKEEEYKSSDLESYTEMSSEFDSDSDFRESDYDHSSEGSDKDENKDHFISEEITKKLPKKPNDKKKISSNKAQVSETEWNDFLEKQVYDKEKDGKEKGGKEENKEVINGRSNILDLEDENEKQKAAQINTHLEAEYAKKRLSTLKNQWNWYYNLIKDITDGHLVLPKELPAEVDEEEEETNDINIKEIKHSDDEIEISEDELFLSDEESTHSNPDPYQESLKYFKNQPSQPSEINETKPPATISEIEPELIPSQISPVDTKSSSPQPSEDKTAPQSLQPLEENKNEQTTTSVTNYNILNTLYEDKDEDEDDDQKDVVDTSNNEFLQNEWSIFLQAFEQCTGIVPDLPEELPDEADEETESTQSSDEVGDKIEIDDESQPVPSLAEPIEPSDSSVSPEEPTNIHSGQDDETLQEEDSPAFHNVGFNKFLQRKEKQHDDDMNKCMYEMYKISGTEKEFKEEHPELFNSESNSKAETKAAIKWHHFKELWNRFVDVATADPSRAFKEYDKIVAAKERAVREGIDVAELLNLKSVPEKEEPKTEYERTEQKIRAHWRKLMKNLKDPQEGLNEHLLQETDNKPDDDISKEAEDTLRAVLSMCDHPERFDMDKYEASLSKEEKDSVMTGEGMKYDKRHNPNAANEIKNASGTSKREGIAQKMWEYFVSLMRKRHELELEKFLADQPQNLIGDKPDQIKDLWQKYITHSTKTQELATGTGEYNEGMDLLWAPETRSRRYRPLPEDEKDSSVQAKTQNGWTKLQEDLHTIQMGTYTGKEPSSLPGNEVTSGWSDLKEEMEKLSTYDKKPMQAMTPPPKMEYSRFPDKNKLDFYYNKQFPEDKAIEDHNSQSYYKTYRNQQIDRPRDQTEYHRVHRTTSYDRNTNPQNLGDYRNGPIKQSQSWQYSPEVDQITTIPLGPNRQSTPYDRNQEYNTRISSQSRWQMSSRESEENENVGGSSRVPLRRNNLPPLQPPGYNPPPLPDPPFMRQGLDTPYYPVKEDRHWPQSDKSFMEPQEQTKTIKNWHSGTRPFQQMQKELWRTQRLNSVNYKPNTIGSQYNDYYGVGTQGEDCIHLMDPKKPQNSYQQRKFEGQPRYNVQQGTNGFPSERDSGMQPFESNTNR